MPGHRAARAASLWAMSDGDYSDYEVLGPEYVVIPLCNVCRRPLDEENYGIRRVDEYDVPVHVECMTEQHPN